MKQWILAAALFLGACGSQGGQGNGTTGSPEVSAQPSSTRAPYDAKLGEKIGLARVDADLSLKMLNVEVHSVALGMKKSPDGTPLSLMTIMAEANATEAKMRKAYVDVLDQLPDGDLRDAVKACFAADLQYVGLFGAEIGERGWQQQVDAAAAERDKAGSKLDAEMALAFK